MIDRVLQWIVDESRWMPVSLGAALVAAALSLWYRQRSGVPLRQRLLAAMNLFYGVTIGTMAFGHLLAVTTKLALGTLRDGSLLALYGIGIALAAPSWWLVSHTLRASSCSPQSRRTAAALNGWTVLTVLALGPYNWPLAIQGLINIAYQSHRRAWLGWGLVGLAAVVGLGLLAASLVFMASGQSFEEFKGI